MMHTQIVSLVLLLVALLAACSAPPSPASPNPGSLPGTAIPDAPAAGAGYSNVTAAQLYGMLASKDFFLVNTHVPDIGKIAGTDASIPYDQTEARLQEYPADKNARIVVYCSSGHMSAIAAQALVQAGYTNVWNLQGGMSAWRQTGYALDK